MAKTFMDSDNPGFAIGITGLIAELVLSSVGLVWLAIGMFVGILIQPLICIAAGGLLGLICGLLAIRQSYVAIQFASSAGKKIPRGSGRTVGIIACVLSPFILFMAISPIIIPLALSTKGRTSALTHRSTRTLQPRVNFSLKRSDFSSTFIARLAAAPVMIPHQRWGPFAAGPSKGPFRCGRPTQRLFSKAALRCPADHTPLCSWTYSRHNTSMESGPRFTLTIHKRWSALWYDLHICPSAQPFTPVSVKRLLSPPRSGGPTLLG